MEIETLLTQIFVPTKEQTGSEETRFRRCFVSELRDNGENPDGPLPCLLRLHNKGSKTRLLPERLK